MAITWKREGRIARMNGKSFEDNPYYPTVCMASCDWAEGWREAYEAIWKYCPHCAGEIKCPNCGQEVI